MPASSTSWWKGRSGFGVYELLLSWWRHRISFVLSLCITVFALIVYYFVFVQETRTPISEFAQRLELNSLDTRFRYRPLQSTHPDPRIVIVDIDQQAQEALGRWPFSRAYFAKMLDILHEDHAALAAFDVTFSKPDQTAAPVRALHASLQQRKQKGESIDPKLVSEVSSLMEEYDADKQLAASIRQFGPVILGNYFLFTQADLQGIPDETLAAYADQISFFAYPPAVASRMGFAKADKIRLMEDFNGAKLVPRGAEANLDILTSSLHGDTSWTGFFNAPPDNDGVVRRTTLVLPYGRSEKPEEWDLYPSLSLMSARAFLGPEAAKTELYYGPVGIAEIRLGSASTIHPDGRGQIMINYQGPWGAFRHYSIVDVLRKNFPPGAFEGKVVLVGATATGIGDLRATPFGGTNFPGVEIHANVIDNILNDRFLKRGSKQALVDALLIVAFGIPLGIWMALVAPRWMWFGMALIGPLVAVDYSAFLHGWWLNFTVPAITLTSNVVLVSLYRALIEDREKRRVRAEFTQFVSPEVVRRLLVNPELVKPRKTEITIMFTDIRGFTTISEKIDAQELANFLNLYLSDMSRIVFNRQGTLDKFIGDAVMAFWGAPFEEPGHAARSCESALDMMKRVSELQKQWETEGKPRLDIGIGLNTGVASVGKMGSLSRAAYTALGDSVNLASRLEGLNKDYGTHILANESTYENVKDSGFIFRELDLIRVKGKLQPVTIYELIGRNGDTTPQTSELLSRFAAARSLYRARSWEKAQQAFQSILETWPSDGPSRTYWKRCQEYLFDEPPLNWDGVFTMDHK